MRHRWGRTVVLVVVVLALVSAGAWWVLLSPLSATPEALELATEMGEVDEELDAWIFEPQSPPETGLILYGGARVPGEAYAPLIRRIVREGHLVVVPRLRLKLAFFEGDAAAPVLEAFDHIDTWALAGHSLGGVMAARFADGDPRIEGLALWASYVDDSVDLSDDDIEVVTIVGDRDGLIDDEDLVAGMSRLPDDAVEVVIAGGNHAQFGDYGPQRGDLEATIPASAQQTEVAAATNAMLAAISE